MKKLILFLIALLLFSCQQEQRSIQIGKELIKSDFISTNTTQISDVVFIGKGLRGKMKELQMHAKQFELFYKRVYVTIGKEQPTYFNS